MVELLRSVDEQAVYLAQPCRLEDRPGLYIREIFNRSRYIRKLQRLGMEFSNENHVRLTPRRTFLSDAWGEFRPAFVIWLDQDEDPKKVTVKSRGLGATTLGMYRLGAMPPKELPHLVGVLQSAPLVSATNPRAVVAHLRDVLR